jgi:5-methylcytosine-specific restriction endonuclease McrA
MASKKYAYRHATLAAVRGNCAVYNPISRVLRMTMDEYVSIVTQPCHYCGIEPNQVSRAPRKLMTPLDFVHHGMDRKDNTSTVYSLDTVVTACAECNKAKGAQTYDEFLDRCRRIALKHPVDNKCQI